MTHFSRRQLMALGCVTLGSRLLLALYLGVWGRPQAWEYDVIAANIVTGAGHTYSRAGFVYAAYSPPLWSYILALLLKLPGSARASVQVLQALFCFGSAVAYGTLARRVSGRAPVGMLAAYLIALQPSLLYYSVAKSDPLTLNMWLLGSIAILGLDLIEKPSAARAAGLGLLLAAGVLSRGTPIVALPLVSIGLLSRWKGRALPFIAITTLTLTLGMAPWLLRNEGLLGRALITTTAGENFWRGNHPGATGGVLDENGGRITSLVANNPAFPANIRRVLSEGTEVDRQDIFMSEGLRFIRERPADAASLFARKMRSFWWKIESDARDYSPWASIVYEVIYRAELVLALFGMLVVFAAARGDDGSGPNRTAAAWAIALMLAVSVLQSAFYVQGRHRFLIEPLLLIFTAYGLVSLGGRAALARGDAH